MVKIIPKYRPVDKGKSYNVLQLAIFYYKAVTKKLLAVWLQNFVFVKQPTKTLV